MFSKIIRALLFRCFIVIILSLHPSFCILSFVFSITPFRLLKFGSNLTHRMSMGSDLENFSRSKCKGKNVSLCKILVQSLFPCLQPTQTHLQNVHQYRMGSDLSLFIKPLKKIFFWGIFSLPFGKVRTLTSPGVPLVRGSTKLALQNSQNLMSFLEKNGSEVQVTITISRCLVTIL